MKNIAVLCVLSQILCGGTIKIDKKCEEAIQFATKIHWNYVNGIASINDSYNATKKAEKICGFKLQ